MIVVNSGDQVVDCSVNGLKGKVVPVKARLDIGLQHINNVLQGPQDECRISARLVSIRELLQQKINAK